MQLPKSSGFLSACAVMACSWSLVAFATDPSEKFDFSFWKLQLPEDANNDGKVDEVDVRYLGNFSHPDYFYLDQDGSLVMTAPNKATTKANSTNAREEREARHQETNLLSRCRADSRRQGPGRRR